MRGRGAPAPAATPPPLPTPVPRRRHCWVQRLGGEVEGLIVEWARRDGGWQALVTYVDGEQLVTRWAPSEALRPA